MEGEAPSLDLVANAISSLYNSPDYTQKADASRLRMSINCIHNIFVFEHPALTI